MTASGPQKPSTSLIARQRRVLGLVAEAAQPGDAEERALIDSMPLPPLELDRPTRPRLLVTSEVGSTAQNETRTTHARTPFPKWQRAAAAATLFAALALVILGRGTPDDSRGLTAKGGGSARLYRESNGQVREVRVGESLGSGDRVRAQLVPGEDGVAMFAVIDRGGALLIPEGRVFEGKLAVRADEPVTFPGSIRLDDSDAGEIAVILSCRAAPEAASGVSALVTAAHSAWRETGVTAVHVPGCDAWVMPLRGVRP